MVLATAPSVILRPFRRSAEAEALRLWTPKTDLGRTIRAALRHLPRELADELIERVSSIAVFESQLSLALIGPDGRMSDYGVVSRKVITDAGVAWLASAFDNTVEAEAMKYHGFGTGTTNEAASQTTLVTELTTEYASDNNRPTGTNNHSSNAFTSVATLSPDASVAITEHGLFNQAANSGGTMFDRSKFAAVNLVGSADSLQATYTGTFTSGG